MCYCEVVQYLLLLDWEYTTLAYIVKVVQCMEWLNLKSVTSKVKQSFFYSLMYKVLIKFQLA